MSATLWYTITVPQTRELLDLKFKLSHLNSCLNVLKYCFKNVISMCNIHQKISRTFMLVLLRTPSFESYGNNIHWVRLY